MKRPTPNLTRLLNKVEAFIACGAGREHELVTFLGRRQPQVNDWLKRKTEPSGEIALTFQNWVALKEAEQSALPDSALVVKAYKSEFRRLEKEHPVET